MIARKIPGIDMIFSSIDLFNIEVLILQKEISFYCMLRHDLETMPIDYSFFVRCMLIMCNM